MFDRPEPEELSLLKLAKAIKRDVYLSKLAQQEALTRARSAGRSLNLAKKELNHGEWTPWLRENCSLSERTARYYMRIDRKWNEIQKKANLYGHDLSTLPLSVAVEFITKPKGLKGFLEDFIEDNLEAGWLYLIEAKLADGNIYKIGYARDVNKRFSQIQADSPIKLNLIYKCYCTEPKALEENLHTQYASKRLHAEWFSLTKEDVEIIRKIKQPIQLD
jgi:hypothetical protein